MSACAQSRPRETPRRWTGGESSYFGLRGGELGGGQTCNDKTPFLRQATQRCFVRKKSRSCLVQYSIVTQAHVHSFKTSSTALEVIQCS